MPAVLVAGHTNTQSLLFSPTVAATIASTRCHRGMARLSGPEWPGKYQDGRPDRCHQSQYLPRSTWLNFGDVTNAVITVRQIIQRAKLVSRWSPPIPITALNHAYVGWTVLWCCKAQIPLCVSRHVSTRHDTYDVSSVSSRVCSNMADDEEAVGLVLACTSLVFCALDLHKSQEKLLERVRWTCPPQSTLWWRPEHVSCESRLSRSSWWACRAVLSYKRDRRDSHETSHHDFYLCQNAWAR